MKLAELNQGLCQLLNPKAGALEITDITHDSRKVQAGSIFVALEGAARDGHDYIACAAQLGAVCILTSTPEKVPCCLPILVHDEPRKAMARLARRLYNDPDKTLCVIGVTGTNGKTTTTCLIQHLIQPLGRCGRIGTLSYFNGCSEEKASRTTPEATDVYRCLGEMVANQCVYTAMEISSHGLALERILGLNLRYALYTNLSQDHLDFHGDMESYFQAKNKIFQLLEPGGIAIVNWDDASAHRLTFQKETRLIRFGRCDEAELRFEVVSLGVKGSRFRVFFEGQEAEFEIPLIGGHNIYNFVGALGVALCEGRSMEEMRSSCADISPVPGRCEGLDVGQDFGVLVDYAHTPDALAKVLQACRETSPRSLLVVFGAGGDRDTTKRHEMGAAVDAHADQIFLTSDNPRNEDPEAIMDMIQQGDPSSAR